MVFFIPFLFCKNTQKPEYHEIAYRVILIIYKIYTLNVVAELLTSLAPFLLLRAHCCKDFCLQRKKRIIRLKMYPNQMIIRLNGFRFQKSCKFHDFVCAQCISAYTANWQNFSFCGDYVPFVLFSLNFH